MQVLGNLLSNAVTYTSPGGRIDLDVKRVGGEVVFQVRDRGAGIAAESLPKLFMLFRVPGGPQGRLEAGGCCHR